VVAVPERVALLLPLMHALLDRGGSRTIPLLAAGPLAPDLRDLLPLAVEIQQIPFGPSWPAQLRETLVWADTVAAALPASETPQLQRAVAAACGDRARAGAAAGRCAAGLRLWVRASAA
jgi:hypothetical protein